MEHALARGDFLRRYEGPDGLVGEEGAFLICSFWLVDAKLAAGRAGDAEQLAHGDGREERRRAQAIRQFGGRQRFEPQLAPPFGGHAVLGQRPRRGFEHVPIADVAMREHGYNVGGEQSGHIILSDFTTTGDGLGAALQVLAGIQRDGRPGGEGAGCGTGAASGWSRGVFGRISPSGSRCSRSPSRPCRTGEAPSPTA